MTAYAGSLSLTNVENATITGFKGPITVNGGVENITMTDVEDFAFSSATGLKTVTLDVDKASDPALTATQKAPSAYAGAVTGYTAPTPDLSFASMSSLTSVTLTGFYNSLSFDGLANLTSVDIDVTTGDLTINNNDNLTSLDVTGSEIGNVTVTNNDAIATVDLDHTTDLNFYGSTTDRTSVSLTVTGNSEMTTLHNSGDKVLTMNVTSNAKLATVDFTGMAATGTGTATIDVYSNALVASLASDTDDGLTQYDVDGTNDTSDLGSFTTTSGIGTLKTYLTAANTASNDIAVHFDTVQLHNIAADAATSSETAGDQNSGNALTYATDGGEKTAWIGAILMNTKSSLSTTNPTSYSAVKAKSGWVLNNSVATTAALTVDGDHIFHDTDGFSAVALSGVGSADVTALLNSTATQRATDLGVTLNVEAQGNPSLPNITFLGSITPTTGNNGENYTNTTASTLSKLLGDSGGVATVLTSYDLVTMTVGDTSVTASITGGTALTGVNATTNLAAQLVSLWNTKYSTGGVSEVFSFWATMSASAGVITAPSLTTSLSGSRAFDDTITITFAPTTNAKVSSATSGTHTTSRLAWRIGSSDATTDNGAVGNALVVTLEEAVAGNNKLALATLTTNIGNITETTAATTNQNTGLILATNKVGFGSSSANSIEGLVATGIFPTDARGDVVTGQAAEGGLDVTTGTARFNRSRLHWLG